MSFKLDKPAVFSVDGYKRDSKDVNNKQNIIASGDITMEDVDFPVHGVDNLGNEKIMEPGKDYNFPGDIVLETPLTKKEMPNFDEGTEGFKMEGFPMIDGTASHLKQKKKKEKEYARQMALQEHGDDVQGPLKQTLGSKGADSDMIMRNQKELDEATKKTNKDLRILENEMDWASDFRNTESEYMRRSGIDRARDYYFESDQERRDLEKTKKSFTYPSGKTKKGSGKLGPHEDQ